MALPAIMTLFFLMTTWRQALSATALGCLALAVGSAWGIPQLQAMDHEWYRLSVVRSPFVFLNYWSTIDFAEPLFYFAILIILSRIAEGQLRRLIVALLFAVGLHVDSMYRQLPSDCIASTSPDMASAMASEAFRNSDERLVVP